MTSQWWNICSVKVLPVPNSPSEYSKAQTGGIGGQLGAS